MIIQSQFKRLAALAFSPRFLLVTNTTIGVGTLVGADFVQQLATHYVYPPKQKDRPLIKVDESDGYVHDTRRSIGMIVGGLYFGVGGHFWYNYLDKTFPGKATSVVLKKLLCEALIGPFFISICYYIIARTEGKSTAEWYKSFKETLSYIILTEWGFFLPLQALNFCLLPPKYRYICVAAITFFYDNILSYIFHQ